MAPYDGSDLGKPLEAQERAETEPSKLKKYVITPVQKFVCFFKRNE